MRCSGQLFSFTEFQESLEACCLVKNACTVFDNMFVQINLHSSDHCHAAGWTTRKASGLPQNLPFV